MVRIPPADGIVFPGIKPGEALSNGSMLRVLDRMGRGDLTFHGFRATFKTWASERMGNRGKREFIQVLRLMEAASKEVVAEAVNDAIRLGAIGFDAVKQIVLARIEKRPARLNLAAYPYLPQTSVRTTVAADYAVLLSRNLA